jgi:fibronectin-binding autotransporter adhesin
LSQVEYSTSPSFSNPANFDTNQFSIPTTENWNTFTASDAPISQGVGTYYFRILSELDPNGDGTISDLLNMGNFYVNGSVTTAANATPMYWDPGKTGTLGSGGSGTWLGSNTWADGMIDYAWSNTIFEGANFGGTAGGNVTLGGSVSAPGGISFLTAGYNITGTAGQVLTVGGTITTNANATISAALTNTGAGTLNFAGTATLTIASTATFVTGTSLSINTGTLIIASGGSVTAKGAAQNVAPALFDSAALTVQGTGSFTTDSTLNLGDQGGNGTLNVQGSGTVAVGSLVVGKNSLGNGATGTVNQSGGTVTAASVLVANGSFGFGTYNLNGGTLAAGSVSGGGGTAAFIFNGGTVETTAGSTNFFSGITSLQVQSGGAVINTNGNNITLAEALTPSSGSTGGLTKTGSGSLLLNLANTITGGVNANGGTLVAAYSNSGVGTFAGGSNVTVNAGGTLQLDGTDSLGTLSNLPVVNVSGGLVTTDTSLSHTELGTVNFTDGTLADAGTPDADGDFILDETVNSLASTSMSTISAAEISLRNDNGHVGGTFNVASGGLPVDLLISSKIINFPSDTAGLTKTGNGTLELTSSNTYTGGTTVSAGELELVNDTAPSSAISIASGAVLDCDLSTRTFQNATTLTGAGTLRETGTGDLVFGGEGNVNVDFSAGALIDVESGELTGSSSYGGIWTSNFASLNLAGGATFDAVESGPTGTMQIDALTGSGTFQGGYPGNGSGGLSTLTIGIAGGSGTFSGVLLNDTSARLGIVKTGTGTEAFTGTNTFTGGTTVNGGTLAIGAASAFPSNSALTIGNGSTSSLVQLSSTAGLVRVSTLTIKSKAEFDIGDNAVLLSDNGTPAITETAVQQYVDNEQIASSYDPSHGTEIAYADGSDGVVAGLPVGEIVIEPALVGDTDLNGTVNIHDIQNLLADFNTPGFWDQGNFNGHADVDISDLQALLTNFNTSIALSYSELANLENLVGEFGYAASPNANGAGFALVAVPEPASGSLLLTAVALLARRRRRN